MRNYFIQIIIITIFYIILNLNVIKCEPLITGRCGIPAVPANTTKPLITSERSRFENKEIINNMCKKGELPLNKYEIQCSNGSKLGKPPRCGRTLNVKAVHLDILDCNSPSKQKFLVSQPLKEIPYQFQSVRKQTISFHLLMEEEGIKTSANGSNCYTFKIRLHRKVQIWFLWIEIFQQKTDKNITIDMNVFVSEYRTCVLHGTILEIKQDRIIFKKRYLCDFNNETDFSKEKENMSDTITLNIQTNYLAEVGLYALGVGEIITYSSNISTQKIILYCGNIQFQNVGVDLQEEGYQKYISCNNMFVDISETDRETLSSNGNPKHIFTCNWNGIWVGHWPQCVPKKSCPKENIMQELDSSVIIEEIGNVYYLNESNWFAINDSFIRYSCFHKNNTMFGQNVRSCMENGKWKYGAPYCSWVRPAYENNETFTNENSTRNLNNEIELMDNPLIMSSGFIILILLIIILLFIVINLWRKSKNRLNQANTHELYEDIKDDGYEYINNEFEAPVYEEIIEKENEHHTYLELKVVEQEQEYEEMNKQFKIKFKN